MEQGEEVESGGDSIRVLFPLTTLKLVLAGASLPKFWEAFPVPTPEVLPKFGKHFTFQLRRRFQSCGNCVLFQLRRSGSTNEALTFDAATFDSEAFEVATGRPFAMAVKGLRSGDETSPVVFNPAVVFFQKWRRFRS